MTELLAYLDCLNSRMKSLVPFDQVGKVLQVTGLLIESSGPRASVGDLMRIVSPHDESIYMRAEVVGFRDNRILLMNLDNMETICPGFLVVSSQKQALIPLGEGLLGRILDGFGNPIDENGVLKVSYGTHLHQDSPNPLKRKTIDIPFETGVKSLDTFVPLGQGQRMGIFAGSGVGKSTLLGMMARGSEADVNVLALIGERGRELRDFIESDLGTEGLKKSVIVVSTSDQAAPLRLRAALMAMRVAEDFRQKGKKVLFLMDSLTRLAMAQREIGISIGEPPSSRGYTPSVFALLPRLLERAGNSDRGSITGIYTVLVEGDDLNEPITDTARGILDGHIVLSRTLAHANHFPAIDVLASISRLFSKITTPKHQQLVNMARDLLSLYKKNEDLITLGAYTPKTNPQLDRAIEKHVQLETFLRQSSSDKFSREESFQLLERIMA